MRVKRRDAEQWMSHRLLPDPLKERIRRYEQYKWQETRGVDEDSLIRNLPKDLRRDIKRHSRICSGFLWRRAYLHGPMDPHSTTSNRPISHKEPLKRFEEGSTHNNGGRGPLVSYRRHGAGIVGRMLGKTSLINEDKTKAANALLDSGL
ncbi:cyclic nucleotide-gated ion channel 1 [Tanacetum coccineum]